MKNFINYLKRVFRVIFNIKEPEQKVIEPQKPTLEYIKQLIDKTAVKEKSQDIIHKEFIANRKAINEYKENYRNFIGYKKPPEPLKSLIEADNKLDVTELNIE